MADQKSVEFIHGMISKYPELLTLTGSVNATPEATVDVSVEKSIGQTLFPHLDKKDLIEFDRTALGLLALNWVLENDYESFTACQKGENKLSNMMFSQLRKFVLEVLHYPDDIETMGIYLVINDLGKVQSVVEMMQQKSGLDTVDHDLILATALRQCPEIAPSFARLSEEVRRQMLTGIESTFNLGQFVQGENVTASLATLNRVDRKSFDLFAVHALFDTAGAAGHAVQNGSVVFNESTVANFLLAIDAIHITAYDPQSSPFSAYDNYICRQAFKLGLLLDSCFPESGCDDDKNMDEVYAVTRLCCQMRVSKPDEAQYLLTVFRQLPRNSRAILLKELNKKGTDDGWAILIYYAPALLLNLKKSMQLALDGYEEYFCLDVLAHLYQHARISIRKRNSNGIFTVMASDIAKAATENPTSLKCMDFRLVAVGDNDAKAELIPVSSFAESNFPQVNSLSQVTNGQRIAFVGIGGGSDCIQAAILAKLMEREAQIEVAAVISVRAMKSQSQSPDGKVNLERTVENYESSPINGVYKLKPESTGSGRFLENLPATMFPTYLVIESTNIGLSVQLQAIINDCEADTVIAVDTGGDALYQIEVEQHHIATPDQDIRSLQAIRDLHCSRKLSCEIAVGVDAPLNAEEILLQAEALYYFPSMRMADIVAEIYRQWDFTGDNDKRFGKTPLAWQMALKHLDGWRALDLPTRVVLDEANPWMPFVLIRESMAGIFFMDVDKHLKSIGC